MVNPKYICISAAVGFVLSFVIGIFSSVAFLHLIIRALIYAAVFAVLSIAINYLSKTFLSSDQTFDSPQSDESSSSSKNSSGNLVNIVVDDSTLRDDSSAPKFSVTNPNIFGDDAFSAEKNQESHSDNISSSPLSTSAKNYSDEKTQNPKEEKSYSKASDDKKAAEKKSADASGFVSADLRSITSSSGNASASANANTTSADDDSGTINSSGSSENLSDSENESELKEDSDDDEIDDLPDIGGIDISSSSSSSDDVIEDTDFATEGSSRSSAASASTEGKDADTMAQAIRTMLAEDK